MKLTVQKIRDRLLSDDVGVNFTLSHPLTDAQANNGLLPCGWAFLREAILCLAAGLSDYVTPLARKAQGFLELSLRTNEIPNRYWPGLDEAQRIILLTFSSLLIDRSLTIACPSEALALLRMADPRQLNGYYCYHLIAGQPEAVVAKPELAAPNPRRISHPDKFAYYLATNGQSADAEDVISGFLSRYARRCIGLTSGLGTPVDLLSAVSATCVTREGRLVSGRIWAILQRSLEGCKGQEN
jgi:hypothetical protein